MRTLIVALMLATAGLAQAADAPPLPKELPPYAADLSWPALQISRRTLANGLTVWVVPRAGIPKVNVTLTVLGGSASDPADAPALSDLLDTLLNEGTTTRSSRQLAEGWQAIGGVYAAFDSPDAHELGATALAAHADAMFELFADIALHPTFPEAEVALAKTNALESLKTRQADPAWLADRAVSAAVFGAHPYGRGYPTAASIAAVTPARLREEYARRFRPDRALLVIAGRIEPEAAFALAEAHFGAWQASGPPPAELPDTPRDAPPARVLVQRDGSVQATIQIGAPSPKGGGPEWMALKVANTIFGGGFAGRLMSDLREDKGDTYSPYSYVGTRRAGGDVEVIVDVRNEVAGPALAETLALLERMATDPPTAEELSGAKRLVVGKTVVSNEMLAALTAWLSSVWAIRLPDDYVATYAARVDAVTAKQITDVAAKVYAPARQSVIVVGDEKAIGAQLKAFGDFTVVAPPP